MFARFAALAVAMAFVVAACGGATTSTDNAGASCASAGGFCTVAECAQQAPTSAQDCSPNGGFGGFYCCLRAEDAGSDDSGGGADDASVEGDAGYAPECVAAGGTCVLAPGAECATLAPNGAQDCNAPGPGGQVCCLDVVGNECHAAGGTCTFLPCQVAAPTGAQDCETNPPNPAGLNCCLAAGASDASVDGDSDASDAAGE